jgi:hypothetical protein
VSVRPTGDRNGKPSSRVAIAGGSWKMTDESSAAALDDAMTAVTP